MQINKSLHYDYTCDVIFDDAIFLNVRLLIKEQGLYIINEDYNMMKQRTSIGEPNYHYSSNMKLFPPKAVYEILSSSQYNLGRYIANDKFAKKLNINKFMYYKFCGFTIKSVFGKNIDGLTITNTRTIENRKYLNTSYYQCDVIFQNNIFANVGFYRKSTTHSYRIRKSDYKKMISLLGQNSSMQVESSLIEPKQLFYINTDSKNTVGMYYMYDKSTVINLNHFSYYISDIPYENVFNRDRDIVSKTLEKAYDLNKIKYVEVVTSINDQDVSIEVTEDNKRDLISKEVDIIEREEASNNSSNQLMNDAENTIENLVNKIEITTREELVTEIKELNFFNDEIAVAAQRTSITIESPVRNQNIVNQIKKLYMNTCQVCQEKLEVGYGVYMSEAHHIKPLGKVHSGPDVLSNLILLCPNHHAMFDRGAITIDIEQEKVIHINQNHPIHNHKLLLKHKIDETYIHYHNENIFIKEKKLLAGSGVAITDAYNKASKTKKIEEIYHNNDLKYSNDIVYYSDEVTLRDIDTYEEFTVKLEPSYNSAFMPELSKKLLNMKLHEILTDRHYRYKILRIKKSKSKDRKYKTNNAIRKR